VQTDCVKPDEPTWDIPEAHFDVIDELWFDNIGEAIAYWSAFKHAQRPEGCDFPKSASLDITFLEEHQVLIPLPR
jgi:hypothetical protein